MKNVGFKLTETIVDYTDRCTVHFTEKSRVFVKVTKTKVLAAYGQIAEVLFGGNKFPISIDPTTLPDGVPDTVANLSLIQ